VSDLRHVTRYRLHNTALDIVRWIQNEMPPRKLSCISLPQNKPLLYGLEVCPLTKAELHSLDFAVTRFLLKLFKTSSIAVTKDCCRCFGLQLPSELLGKRFTKFMSKRKYRTSWYSSLWPRGYNMTQCSSSIVVAFSLLVFLLMRVCICIYQSIGATINN